ncbi:MAG TPA: hypothetical protein VL523_13090, partial [Terriglobia bacterium]|nr:hypothetical protein [Terriglobia bacterium]
MKRTISALLVGAPDKDSDALERALHEQSVRSLRVGTCREAQKHLQKLKPPHLLFTETSLPDG